MLSRFLVGPAAPGLRWKRGLPHHEQQTSNAPQAAAVAQLANGFLLTCAARLSHLQSTIRGLNRKAGSVANGDRTFLR
jgi:hypothetical protein